MLESVTTSAPLTRIEYIPRVTTRDCAPKRWQMKPHRPPATPHATATQSATNGSGQLCLPLSSTAATAPIVM